MKNTFHQWSSLPNRHLLRHVLVAVSLCLVAGFFTAAAPTAQAATSSPSIAKLLLQAGYVQVTHQNFHQYVHASLGVRQSTASINASSSGPFLFTDNIQSNANGLFVSAELGYTGGNNAMLRARTSGSALGPWEQFQLFCNGTCVIVSNANNLAVSAELGYTGGNYAMLRARTSTSALGPWEQFNV